MQIPELWIGEINVVKLVLGIAMGLIGGYANSLYSLAQKQPPQYSIRLPAGAIAGFLLWAILSWIGQDYHFVLIVSCFAVGYFGIDFLEWVAKKFKPFKEVKEDETKEST